MITRTLFILSLVVNLLPADDSQLKDLPDPLTRSELEKIIKDTDLENTAPPELSTYPIIKTAVPIEITHATEKQKSTQKANLTISSSRSNYIVIRLTDEKKQPLRTDVIRHHFKSKAYHRWIFDHQKKSVHTLIGHSTHFLMGDHKIEKKFYTAFLWQDAKPQENSRTFLRESTANFGLKSKMNSISFTHIRFSSQSSFKTFAIDYRNEIDRIAKEDKPEKAGLLSRFFSNDKEEKNKAGEIYTFKDLNFTFAHPEGGYRNIDGTNINPLSKLYFVRTKPRMTNFLVISENLGRQMNLSTENLLKHSHENFKSAYPKGDFSETKDIEINGIKFKTYSFQVTQGLFKKVTHVAFITSHNGYAHQFLSITMTSNREAAEKEALKIAQGFRLIDPKRYAEGQANAVADYHNKEIGIKLDANPLKPIAWENNSLWEQFPAASYGLLLGDNAGFYLIPVDLLDHSVSDHALTRGLMHQAGFHFDNEVTGKKEHVQGVARGHSYTAIYKDGSGEHNYRFRLLRNENTACLLTAFTLGKKKKDLDELEALMDLVEFSAPLPLEKRRSTISPRDHMVLNRIGIEYYNQNRFPNALTIFEEAFAQKPDNSTYLNNIVNALQKLNRNEDALNTLRKNLPNFQGDLDIASLEPDILSSMNRPDEAIAKYSSIFKKGHQNEDHLLAYITLLNENNKTPDALKVINDFLTAGRGQTLRPRRWQHQLYSSSGDTRKALELARKLAKEYPGNNQLQNDLIIALNEDKKTSDVIERVAARLPEEPENTFLHYQLGLAHYEARNYQKAKESFEKAQKLSPHDTDVADMLSLASASLGQGDQSAIRQKIDPVKIPEAILELHEKHKTNTHSPGYNSKRLQSITGYHFEKNKPLLTTYHRVTKILNQAGVTENKSLRFGFDPTYETAYVNSIEVRDADGKTIARGKTSDAYVTAKQDNNGMATTETTVTAPIPGVKPGCTIHLTYTLKSKFNKTHFPYTQRVIGNMTTAGPLTYFITGDLQHIKAVASDELIATQTDKLLAWTHPSPPLYYSENKLPSVYDYFPSISIGDTTGDWEKIVHKYLENIKDRLEPTDQIDQLAKQITINAKTELEKTHAILAYVKKELTYQAIEFGIRAQTPNKVSKILSDRYGDCKDHSLLAHQLLKASGIPSHLALVNTSAPIRQALPSLDQFDHVIIHTPSLKDQPFHDCTNESQDHLHTIAPHLHERVALIIDAQNPRFTTIKANRISKLTLHRQITLLDNLEDFLVQEDAIFTGPHAGYMREWLQSNNAAQHKAQIAQQLGYNHNLDIQELHLLELDNLDQPLTVRLTYQISRGLEKRGDTYQGNLPALWEEYYLATNASTKRKSPFENQLTIEFDSQISFFAPDKAHLPEILSSPKDIQNSWISQTHKMIKANQQPQKAGTQHILKFKTVLKEGTHSATDHANYTRTLQNSLKNLTPHLQIKP